MTEQGFSLIELIVSMLLFSIISAYAVYQLTELNDPAQNGVNQTIAFVKEARARAIASTSAYRVSPGSASTLIAETALNCQSDDFEIDTSVSMELPSGVSYDDIEWDICFSSRGLPDGNIVIGLSGHGDSKALEVYLGGAVRELE